MALWHRRSSAGPPAVAPPRERAWSTLPQLQRVVEAIEPVAPREPFVASLTSHHDPSFLAPLAHIVDPNGPSGRIGGLVTAAPPAHAPTVQTAPDRELSVIRRWVNRPRPVPVIARLTETSSPPTPGAERSAPAVPASDAVHEHVQLATAEYATAEYATAEYATTEYATTGQQPVETVQRDAMSSEPVQSEPVHRDAVQPGPLHYEPEQSEPLHYEPEQSEPLHYEPEQSEPVHSEPVHSDPLHSDAVQSATVQHEVVQREVVQHDAMSSEPVQAPAAGPPTQRPIADLPLQLAVQRAPVDRSTPAPPTPSTPPAAVSTLGTQVPTPVRMHEAAVPVQRRVADSPIAAGQPPAGTPAARAFDSEVATPVRGPSPAQPPEAVVQRSTVPTSPIPTADAPAERSLPQRTLPVSSDPGPLVSQLSAGHAVSPTLPPKPAPLPLAAQQFAPPQRETNAEPAMVQRADAPADDAVDTDVPRTVGTLPGEIGLARAEPAVERSVPPVQRMTGVPLPPVTAHRTVQRKLGLGEPSTSAPPARETVSSLSLQQWAVTPDLTSVQRTATAEPAVADIGTAAVFDETAPPVERPLLGQYAHEVPDAAPPPSTPSVPAELPPALRTSAALSPMVQRLVDSRPALSTSAAQVQRSLAPESPPEQRTAPRLGLGAPITSGTALPAKEMHPQTAHRYGLVQRAAEPSAPPVWDAGSVAVSAGLASRADDGSVVFSTPEADEPSIQRAADEPLVQRAPGDAAAAAPSPQPAASGGAAPAAPGAASTQNIDDLVRRLYDPLAARLKAELRLDRERAGLVTDLRRP